MIEYCLIAIIFYFSIVLHEFMHLIGYKLCGLKIKRFYICPINFVSDSHLNIEFAFEKNYMGLVLPYNYNGYSEKQLRRKTIIALALPIICHVFLSIFSAITYHFCGDEIFLDISLINILCACSTVICSGTVFGDLVAIYHIFKNDDLAQKIMGGVYGIMPHHKE